jgi:Holliday junction DNA helicase RuvB
VRDFAQVHGHEDIDDEVARTALQLLEVDTRGLEETDRKILLAIATTFSGGPVGVKSIAAAVSEEEATIEDVYEPYLCVLGLSLEPTADALSQRTKACWARWDSGVLDF